MSSSLSGRGVLRSERRRFLRSRRKCQDKANEIYTWLLPIARPNDCKKGKTVLCCAAIWAIESESIDRLKCKGLLERVGKLCFSCGSIGYTRLFGNANASVSVDPKEFHRYVALETSLLFFFLTDRACIFIPFLFR